MRKVNGNVGDDVFTLFLGDLERYPVPSPERERELGRLIQDGLQARRILAGKTVSRKEKTKLLKQVQAGDAAYAEMVCSNLRLVVHWAKQFRDRGVELVDLVQDGITGLMHAVEKFDWTKGYKFSTYGSWWIRQALQRSVAASSAIRLPLEVFENRGQIARLCQEFMLEHHRSPTREEIADRLGLTVSRIRFAETAAIASRSLDHPAADDVGAPLGELVAKAEDPTNDVIDALERSEVQEAVRRLPKPYRTVIQLRFGIGVDRPHSINEVSTLLSMGTRRVRVVERDGITLLRGDRSLAA